MSRQASVSGGTTFFRRAKRPLDAPPPETGVDPGGGIIGQEAKSDVAPVEETEAERPAAGIRRKNDLSRLRLPFHRGQGPGEEPGVTMAKCGVPSLLEYDPWVVHALESPSTRETGELATPFCRRNEKWSNNIS